MKKATTMILAVILLISLCACGSSAGSGSTEKAEKKDTATATIGDYNVTIKGYELKQDDAGNDCIFVTYEFTNNSEENISIDNALYTQCFQNGTEMEFGEVYIQEKNTDPLYENKYKDIQSGTMIETKEAFILQDSESPISAEVISMDECLGGESSGKAAKEFKISK